MTKEFYNVDTTQRKGSPRDYIYFIRNGSKIYGHPDMVIECIECFEIKNQTNFDIRWTDEYGIRTLFNVCKKCKYAQKQILNKIKKSLNELPPVFCELCNKKDVNKIQVDHDHTTLKFRGWLCNPCNTSLGKFKDDPLMLLNAIKYLLKNNDYVKIEELKNKLKLLIDALEQKI